MNTRNLPASVLMLAIGAGAVLLIGAFARFDPANSPHPTESSPSPPLLTQDDPPDETAAGPTLPAQLSPRLAEIIKLAQAHVDESVILAYIKNSGEVFSPTADEILYLSDLGVSQDVIGNLIKTAPLASAPQPMPETASAVLTPSVPMAPPVAASAPPPEASAGVFYNDLASYGTWTQQADYGLCWQPTVETIDAGWRPYVDAGQWLFSDSGWYWQSDYTWGWAAFHYGRWARVPHLGWVWVPGNVWAPAWVAWRSNPSYIGWAALPPGVSLNVMAQLTYLGRPAGLHATFGLPPWAYSFVQTGDLTSRHLPGRLVPTRQVGSLVQSTVVIDSYAIVNHRIFNGGASREAVAAAAHKAVPQVTLRGVSALETAGLAVDRKTLAVYSPSLASAGATPAKPLTMNNPSLQSAAEKLPEQKPIALAENGFAHRDVMPVARDEVDGAVQLPPLRYGAPADAPVVRHFHRDNMVAASPGLMPAHHGWPRGAGSTIVEHPATPAPRFDGFNPPGRQMEPPQFAMENRGAQIENRPAQVENRAAQIENRVAPVREPARAAPAPVAPSSSGSTSRSGK